MTKLEIFLIDMPGTTLTSPDMIAAEIEKSYKKPIESIKILEVSEKYIGQECWIRVKVEVGIHV